MPALAQQLPQQVRFSSTANPVGSGARAVGMGGAFIAVADDATAASWNPAGLCWLRRPEFSIAFSHTRRREDFSSRSHPETGGMQKESLAEINYMSFVLPFRLWEHNMVVSLNYQRLYEFDRDIDIDFDTWSRNPYTLELTRYDQRIAHRQQGGLKALSPAYAVRLTPNLSLGITFNIWTDKLFWSNGWETDTRTQGQIIGEGRAPIRYRTTDSERYSGFTGFNLHLGALWKMNRYITVGAVVKTPFRAKMDQERVFATTMLFPNMGSTRSVERLDEDADLEMPLSCGIGMAVRLSDRLTFSLDVYKTEWSHYVIESEDGRRMSPVTGRSTRDSHVRPTTQVRLGGEYLFVFPRVIVPLRLGVFYDPEPSETNPEDYWGLSVGTGISFVNMAVDAAYQFRAGDDVAGTATGIPASTADVVQHQLMVSVIYYF
ncbi:MAG: hypothetical protein GY868_10275 [Deltaproteobacteria bacterium]|nr:hypothetical protein [Deltaproteobacteria bacterium]